MCTWIYEWFHVTFVCQYSIWLNIGINIRVKFLIRTLHGSTHAINNSNIFFSFLPVIIIFYSASSFDKYWIFSTSVFVLDFQIMPSHFLIHWGAVWFKIWNSVMFGLLLVRKELKVSPKLNRWRTNWILSMNPKCITLLLTATENEQKNQDFKWIFLWLSHLFNFFICTESIVLRI